jgi:uncharacterized Zn finger protein (UPF0148 family)
MSRTSETTTNEKHCGNCHKLLIKNGKLKCPRCGEECPIHPEQDETKSGTLASARRIFMTNWDSLLILDTRVHLKRCEVAQFEYKVMDLAGKGERVWESDTYVTQCAELLYGYLMMVNSLERCRDSYMATSGIMQERVFSLVDHPDVYEDQLRSVVADCIRLQREGTLHCAAASRRVNELKQEQSELRNLWRQEKFSPTRSERQQELEEQERNWQGKPLLESERKELKVLQDALFLAFRKNVARAYLEKRLTGAYQNRKPGASS